MNRQYRNRKFLYNQYVENDKSAADIADYCGVASSTISRWLERHEIGQEPKYRNQEWLIEQYVERRQKQQDIAEECDVATTTICHWLSRHGITDGESMETTRCSTCDESFRYYPSVREGQYCSNRCANETRQRQVEVTCPNCQRTFTRRRSLDTTYCSMRCWGEDVRAETEHFYSTDWLNQREKALARDGYRCTICGISDEEHRCRFDHGLDVHHIVPIRLFVNWDKPPVDAHSLRNLVSVCRTHHPDSPGTTVEPES